MVGKRWYGRAAIIAQGSVIVGIEPMTRHRDGAGQVRMEPAGLVLQPPDDAALRADVTEAGDHFVLAHHGIARCSEERWTLVLDGLVDRELALSLDDLRARQARAVHAVLECAGNPEVPDKPTRFVSAATWRGVALRDLLAEAGVRDGAAYVWMEGADWGSYAGVDNDAYVKDVSLAKALDGDVLLAYEMNGRALPAEHGFPLRAVVPGYYGTNSVKWLTRVSVSHERPGGLFTTRLYTTVHDGEIRPVWAVPVNSRLIAPTAGEALVAGEQEIAGRAWGHDPVVLVEVSVDGGDSWSQAALEQRTDGHAWQRFRLAWSPAPGEYEICVRATDATGAVQPAAEHINQVQRVPVTVAGR
jgi:DMSO/TMAO reductase YedYZ molybdopterin-dependent catalytic subunit